jgi:hypothetical protein
MSDPAAAKQVGVSYLQPPSYAPRETTVGTVEELGRLLRAVQDAQAQEPYPGVLLRDERGNDLCVGLAQGGWLLMYGDAERTYQAFSGGDPALAGDVTFLFHQWEQLPRRHLVPAPDADKAIRDWFATGKPSASIRWDIQPY